MFLESRIEKAYKRLALLSLGPELQVRQRSARHGSLFTTMKIFIGNMGEILAQVLPNQLAVRQCIALYSRRNDRIDDALPDVATATEFGTCHYLFLRPTRTA